MFFLFQKVNSFSSNFYYMIIIKWPIHFANHYIANMVSYVIPYDTKTPWYTALYYCRVRCNVNNVQHSKTPPWDITCHILDTTTKHLPSCNASLVTLAVKHMQFQFLALKKKETPTYRCKRRYPVRLYHAYTLSWTGQPSASSSILSKLARSLVNWHHCPHYPFFSFSLYFLTELFNLSRILIFFATWGNVGNL